ncbi:MAG: PAS domain S-box protein, partial [Betaproteobacteria bacterium]|nr:PAS domain S-box protein [Betaproteobacteria bacterium]
LGAAHFSFKYFSGRVIQNAQENLLAIARLKSAQIGMLIGEKMRDGRMFSTRPAVQYILRGQLKDKAGPEIERLVASFIADSISISGYRRIFITDTDSRLVAPSANGSLEPSERAALESAMKTRKPALADIHARLNVEADFGIAYPVIEGSHAEGRVLGAVYLESEVRKTLFPLLISWPTSSPSAESSLVRREGDEVVILSPLKQDPAAPPLSIRFPMSEEGRLGTRAIKRGETLIEARDSRGIEVIAAAYPVAGTPWVLLSKVDREEVERPVQVLAATTAALVALLLALSAAISWLLLRWRSQSLALERLDLAERYATAARTSIDGYLVLDFHSGAIIEANNALARMTGYSEGELLSLTIADMVADRPPLQIAKRGRKLAETGADRFHGRWKRKDGSAINVEVSMTYLPDGSGGHVHAYVRDVTERKRAEDALARESYRNQAFLRNSSDGVHILDAEGNVLEASDSFCGMLGYSRDELIGANVTKWDAQWSPDALRQKIKEHIEKRGPSEIETLHRRRDGTVMDVEVTANPLELDGKKVLFASARDITERKQREREIDALNRLYRTLSAVNAAIVRSADRRELCQRVCEIADKDGRWAATWIGFVDEDTKWIVPEAWSDSMAPFIENLRLSTDPDLPEGRGPTGISVRSGTPYFCNDVYSDPVMMPWRALLKDSGVASAAVVPIRSAAVPCGVLNLYSLRKDFFSPDVQALLVEICDDLSYAIETFELKARQQSLEARLAGIVESSSDSISAADLNGVITNWNAGAAALYGYAAEEIVGKSVLVLVPEDRRAEHEALVGSIREGRSVSNYKTVRKAKGGRLIDVALTLSPIKDAEGRVISHSAIARDITEAKRLEREILALNETLERRVAERTRELENANRELDSFSYSVSHDLRAPLRALVGFTGIIQQEHAGALDAQGRQLLDRIVHNSARMGKMIDDLLRLSRLGRAALELRPVDLNSLVSEVVRNELAEHPRTKVDVARLPTVTGDPGLLRQAFQNLLANAFKFSAKAQSPAVSVGIEPAPDGPVFFVRDNGAGFDMQYADKLFGVFQRLHPVSEFPGTGVGLVIVKRIIERHGGRVWAESAPGAGATFRFTLGASA